MNIKLLKYSFWVQWNQASCCKTVFDGICLKSSCMGFRIGLKEVKLVNIIKAKSCFVLN